jgi:hypothetical protein
MKTLILASLFQVFRSIDKILFGVTALNSPSHNKLQAVNIYSLLPLKTLTRVIECVPFIIIMSSHIINNLLTALNMWMKQTYTRFLLFSSDFLLQLKIWGKGNINETLNTSP